MKPFPLFFSGLVQLSSRPRSFHKSQKKNRRISVNQRNPAFGNFIEIHFPSNRKHPPKNIPEIHYWYKNEKLKDFTTTINTDLSFIQVPPQQHHHNNRRLHPPTADIRNINESGTRAPLCEFVHSAVVRG